MHFLQILKQVVYPANNVLEGAASKCPFQNNHSLLNLLYMYATIKQNILYNKCKHCYTDRQSLLNNKSSMLHENFMFYTFHQTYISQRRISKNIKFMQSLANVYGSHGY